MVYRTEAIVATEKKEELLFKRKWWRPWNPKVTHAISKEEIYSFRWLRKWTFKNYFKDCGDLYYTTNGRWVLYIRLKYNPNLFYWADSFEGIKEKLEPILKDDDWRRHIQKCLDGVFDEKIVVEHYTL